jgi:hypothetical protein
MESSTAASAVFFRAAEVPFMPAKVEMKVLGGNSVPAARRGPPRVCDVPDGGRLDAVADHRQRDAALLVALVRLGEHLARGGGEGVGGTVTWSMNPWMSVVSAANSGV